ncbi:hypothetical protein [Streptomyces sp. NPDC024089]|uniref:hypothetical protein n=1 Tax=Streptomyces sp. NPDC024089 TaxID=3154328 RepID=UPI003404D94B
MNGHPRPLPVLGEWQAITDPTTDDLQAEAAAVAEQVLADARGRADQISASAADRSKEIIEKATAQAQWTAEEAKGLRSRTIAGANAEAKRIVAEARAAAEAKQEKDDKFDTWSARLVIGGAVGLTASGEYELARMVGFDWYAAWLLPFVIDIYVIQAFRRHRDILQAITLTIAANVTFHLADKGLFGVERVTESGNEPEWWLIALVASIASLILWRMHIITGPAKTARGRRGKVAHQGQQTETRLLVSAQVERPERPASAPVSAPTGRVQEAASGRETERPIERPDERSAGRPRKAKSGRAQSAQTKPKKSASKTLAERRQERVEALYDELGKRPEWGDIRDALAAAKLADKSISRSSCQRIRDAAEASKPHLAAVGSENVRPITGTS